ncbi:hypothetical protein AB395_0000721 [Sinorhizobium fredii CCBAU 45436]|nr:hypothetical protein SF83666_c06920 [Sinorhizobium fredii CCBAU 83666]AWI56399.1 hypothetical protein AB395_0000721 [Sinorhizobium fredii CCBAU 45436]
MRSPPAPWPTTMRRDILRYRGVFCSGRILHSASANPETG